MKSSSCSPRTRVTFNSGTWRDFGDSVSVAGLNDTGGLIAISQLKYQTATITRCKWTASIGFPLPSQRSDNLRLNSPLSPLADYPSSLSLLLTVIEARWRCACKRWTCKHFWLNSYYFPVSLCPSAKSTVCSSILSSVNGLTFAQKAWIVEAWISGILWTPNGKRC